MRFVIAMRGFPGGHELGGKSRRGHCLTAEAQTTEGGFNLIERLRLRLSGNLKFQPSQTRSFRHLLARFQV
jgi:hypothetical protein